MNQPKFFATKSGDVLAALICGNGSLSCGGQAMEYLNANTSDGASEKHVPVVEMEGGTLKVSVGSVFHPMTTEHSIGWVCLVTRRGWQLRALPVDENPVTEFAVARDDSPICVYAWCNLHGLWKTEL
ncbi:desulfoferrodoxin family protein [Anaerotruncus colihominis]|jgi:superoxide reductase|nr:desulfoferrodoxin family protein [Anaerotruncus colihominis]MBS4989018.1 desulfoferrodoxin [Anaerotruncus colihominis]MCQ4733949.1 desulfoferrodoxin family protein [Anaerotruncus colihominis]OUO68952.1 hypothetical protein B5F55_01660 [Anaerotruncus colihominis]UOX65138.1 desulfoferrodoxin [Anaerotruncus colihominis]UWN73602.1 desulfoferrodoxin family protein [Anaerotruncus colihominis]